MSCRTVCVAAVAMLWAGCAPAQPAGPAPSLGRASTAGKAPIRDPSPPPAAVPPQPARPLPEGVQPRISVRVVDERVATGGGADPRQGTAAENLVVAALLECGFVVVDHRVERGKESLGVAPGGGSPTKSGLLPDLFIVGEVKELGSVRSVSLRAVIPHSNVVLTRAHGYGTTLEVAGRLAADNLSLQLPRLWQGSEYEGRTVQLVVAGLRSLGQGREIEATLAREVDDIPHVQVYGYKQGTLSLDIISRMGSPAIVELLTGLDFDGARLGVEEARHFAIFLRMESAPASGAASVGTDGTGGTAATGAPTVP